MAKLLFLFVCTGVLFGGALAFCNVAFAMPPADAAPHAIIALVAVAVHLLAQRTLPAYGDALAVFREFVRWLVAR